MNGGMFNMKKFGCVFASLLLGLIILFPLKQLLFEFIWRYDSTSVIQWLKRQIGQEKRRLIVRTHVDITGMGSNQLLCL